MQDVELDDYNQDIFSSFYQIVRANETHRIVTLEFDD